MCHKNYYLWLQNVYISKVLTLASSIVLYLLRTWYSRYLIWWRAVRNGQSIKSSAGGRRIFSDSCVKRRRWEFTLIVYVRRAENILRQLYKRGECESLCLLYRLEGLKIYYDNCIKEANVSLCLLYTLEGQKTYSDNCIKIHFGSCVNRQRWEFTLISPLPVKPGGTLGFLAVRHSVHLSVSPSVSPLGVRPLRFPNFSQSSFEILTWNLVCEFLLT